MLPRDESMPEERAALLDARRDTYRFVYDWPAGVATSSWLPAESDYSKAYTRHLTPVYASIAANFAAVAAEASGKLIGGFVSRVKAAVRSFETDTVSKAIFRDFHEHARSAEFQLRPDRWDGYDYLFATWDAPDVVARARSASFADAIAWQRIAGVNPAVLSRCRSLPDGFAVTAAHVAAALPDDTLAAALAEGRAFVADYRGLEGVPCGETRGAQMYIAGPIALYVADRRGTLRAVAVQCGGDPSRYPVRTPSDGWHWRMANHCVQVADANHHEGSTHLGRTHLVMEAVGVAMKRELAAAHPLAVLLEIHLGSTFAINHSAKTDLIGPGGTVDLVFAPKIRAFGGFVQSCVSTYSIRNADPRHDLAARGLDDTEVLPVHPYRDDMLPVHRAIRDHVDGYVRLYYTSAAEVAGDHELAAFVAALGATDGGRLHDVPEVATVDQLVSLITSFVWIATAQHSAVNFPQYRFMAYPPNMAGALFTPPPDVDAPGTEEAFRAMLPPIGLANNGASMVYLLSELRDSQLGAYDDGAFGDPRVAPLISRFQAALRDIERQTAARDPGRFLPYPYLLPSQILQSISI